MSRLEAAVGCGVLVGSSALINQCGGAVAAALSLSLATGAAFLYSFKVMR